MLNYTKWQKCPFPECYKSFRSETDDELNCKTCDSKHALIKHICFVDELKNKIKMSKILNEFWILDGALLIVAANEKYVLQEKDEKNSDKDKNLFFGKFNIKSILIQNKIDIVMKNNSAKEQ